MRLLDIAPLKYLIRARDMGGEGLRGTCPPCSDEPNSRDKGAHLALG